MDVHNVDHHLLDGVITTLCICNLFHEHVFQQLRKIRRFHMKQLSKQFFNKTRHSINAYMAFYWWPDVTVCCYTSTSSGFMS
jgi:hypothetical protein